MAGIAQEKQWGWSECHHHRKQTRSGQHPGTARQGPQNLSSNLVL